MMHNNKINIKTNKKEEFIEITKKVQEIVAKSKIKNGTITLFVPHTTAAVTINENADPDVVIDLLHGLKIMVPNHTEYRHLEGNSDAHLKASLIGVDQTLLIEAGRLVLGTWQGIYFCEFDGPRTRTLFMKAQGE